MKILALEIIELVKLKKVLSGFNAIHSIETNTIFFKHK